MDLKEAYDLTSDFARNREKVTLEEAKTLIKSKKIIHRQGSQWLIKALQAIIDAHETTTTMNDMPDLPILDQMWMMLLDMEDNVRIMKEMILRMKER